MAGIAVKLYLNVEWADVLATELVSIALVSDDGHHTFYGEHDPLPAEPLPWVATVVYPLLERGAAAMSDDLLIKSLRTFLASIQVPVIVYDSPHDCALCLYVLDGMDEPEPEGQAPVIAWLHLDLDANRERWWRDHPEHLSRRHHAAVDALALRGAWLRQQGELS